MSTDDLIINGLSRRRGPQAAHHYAKQTMQVYRGAVLNPQHFASTSHYRRAFIMSYLFYKHFLQTHVLPPSASNMPQSETRSTSGKYAHKKSIEEREHCIDEELSTSMPASDAPSWTLGGSCISKPGSD